MTRIRAILVACSVVAVVAGTIRADEPKWKQHTVNGRSEFEAAGVFDVDNDGHLDIISGDAWYQGPAWKPYHVRDVHTTILHQLGLDQEKLTFPHLGRRERLTLVEGKVIRQIV